MKTIKFTENHENQARHFNTFSNSKLLKFRFFLQFRHIVTFVTLVALPWKFGILNRRQCWNYFYLAQLCNHCSLNTTVFPILS